MKRLILCLLAAVVAGALLFGWGYRRGAASVEVEESVRVVPVYYEKPEPVRVAHTSATVRVPALLFAPADTVRETVLVHFGPDSAELRVAIERQEYGGRDTSFYAVVSGPTVGGLRPRLDRLELYMTERLRTVTIREPYRWQVGPAAGAWYAPAGGGAWLGGYVRRSFGRVSLSAAAGYDLNANGAFGQVQADVAVWRK